MFLCMHVIFIHTKEQKKKLRKDKPEGGQIQHLYLIKKSLLFNSCKIKPTFKTYSNITTKLSVYPKQSKTRIHQVSRCNIEILCNCDLKVSWNFMKCYMEWQKFQTWYTLNEHLIGQSSECNITSKLQLMA